MTGATTGIKRPVWKYFLAATQGLDAGPIV